MAKRILWNEHEEAILLQALINVLNHNVERKQAITTVSKQLRKLAALRGIEVDDKFRNENGIALQMSKLEYAFTDGKTGLRVDTGWYFEITRMYKENLGKYQKLLKEAQDVSSYDKAGKNSFTIWVQNQYPDCASSVLTAINMLNALLLKNKITTCNIQQIFSKEEIDSLLEKLKSSKGITIHGRRNKTTFANSLEVYREYLTVTEIDENYEEGKNGTEDEQTGLVGTSSQKSKLSFYDWLVKIQGLSKASGRNYASAINTADMFAHEHNIGYGTIRDSDDLEMIKRTIEELFESEEFLDINARQHNRMRTSLRKYVKYLYGSCIELFDKQTVKPTDKTTEEDFSVFDSSLYKEILSSYFPNGFRILSNLDMRRFRVFWLRNYNQEITESDETVRKYIECITIRHRDFVYLPETMLDSKKTQKIIDYIRNCFEEGKVAIYFDALYKEFQAEFTETHINNPEMLRSYLIHINTGEYFVKKNYVACSSKESISASDEIRDYLISAGVPVAIEDLKMALSHIDEDVVFGTIAGHNSAEYVRNQKGEYFHADIIQFTKRELVVISELIKNAIDDKDYMGGKELTDAIEIKLPEIKERYPFLTWLGLRDVIAYKLQDVFSFKGKIISKHGQDLSMSDVFAHFASSHEYFTIQQLNRLKRDLDTPIYFDSVYENSLRINKDEFVSRSQANFNIEATDTAIGRFCTGDYIALKDISFFGSFPYVGFPWNSFLLEHYVAFYSKEFKLLHIGFNASAPVGVVVKHNAECGNFDELVCTELAISDIPLKRDDALQYLVDVGFIARKNYSGIEQILIKAKAQRIRKG